MERQTRPNGDWYDAARVKRACEFAECLTITKCTKSNGPELVELLPHTRQLIEGIHGWRRADGRRRTRKVFSSMGRKQAKTQTAAILVAIEFFMSDEAEQEIYFSAKERKQASICFQAVAGMIKAAPELLEMVRITESDKLIRHLGTGSMMTALSSDGAGKHGYNPSMVVYDELHAWGAPEQELYDALSTGSKSRKEPLWITITTAGSDKETICGQEYDYAKRVLSGDIKDPSYLALIYEVAKDADWTDRTLWPNALPLLKTGHHSIDDYEEEFQQALARPAEQNKFRRLYLNQWTSSVTQWITMMAWDACGDTEITEAEFAHLDCWGGLDLGSTGDFTALYLCWPMPDGRVVVRSWAYVPLDTLDDRQKRDGKPYRYWVERGWLRTTAGQTTDQDEVFAHIEELNDRYRIQGIACDRWRIKYIEKRMEQAGIEAFDWGQGYQSMAPAINLFESLVFNRQISHDKNECLRWNMDCCQVMSDPAGNKKLVKPQTSINSRHIDMAVAGVMAIGAATINIGEVDPYSNGARLVAL